MKNYWIFAPIAENKTNCFIDNIKSDLTVEEIENNYSNSGVLLPIVVEVVDGVNEPVYNQDKETHNWLLEMQVE